MTDFRLARNHWWGNRHSFIYRWSELIPDCESHIRIRPSRLDALGRVFVCTEKPHPRRGAADNYSCLKTDFSRYRIPDTNHSPDRLLLLCRYIQVFPPWISPASDPDKSAFLPTCSHYLRGLYRPSPIGNNKKLCNTESFQLSVFILFKTSYLHG